MNQSQIVDSLGDHLDSLKQTVGWALLLSVAFCWAGLTQADPVNALGFSVTRSNAFLVAAIFYVFVNAKLLDLLIRIGDLVQLLNRSHVVEGLTKVALHPFIANPFSYFGTSPLARVHSSKGFGALIFVWWVANSSLFTLAGDQRPTDFWVNIFFWVGIASMWAISRAYNLSLEAVCIVDDVLHAGIKATTPDRVIGAFLGVVLGGLFAVGVLTHDFGDSVTVGSTNCDNSAVNSSVGRC